MKRAAKTKTTNGQQLQKNGDAVHRQKLGCFRRKWKPADHHTLPDFLRDNEFLLKGHRPELNSFIECFKSILHVHTETGNIWTHLVGSLGFVLITLYFISRPSDEISLQQKFTFSVYFAGAITCMCISWVFHTVCCHSKKVATVFNKLDYCGIIILIVTSFTPWLHYGFYCSDNLKIGYMVAEILVGFLCLFAVLDDRFRTPKYRVARAALFIGLGLTGAVPGVHFLISNGVSDGIRFFIWLVLMAFAYIVGGVIYALRVPERLFPGKFDIWGHSHQIMHLCVIVGALFCYHGASDLARCRLASSAPCHTLKLD